MWMEGISARMWKPDSPMKDAPLLREFGAPFIRLEIGKQTGKGAVRLNRSFS